VGVGSSMTPIMAQAFRGTQLLGPTVSAFWHIWHKVQCCGRAVTAFGRTKPVHENWHNV